MTLSLSFPPSLRAAAARDTDPLFATHIVTPRIYKYTTHIIHYKNTNANTNTNTDPLFATHIMTPRTYIYTYNSLEIYKDK